MAAPNMAAITASLERSMQNCSLNQSGGGGNDGASAGVGFSSSPDSPGNQVSSSSDVTLELNSQISLPYFWEQCLDLKVQASNLTGEVYYINWKTGMKAKDDPRTLADQLNDDIYSEDDSSYDSEESSSESSPTPSRNQQYHNHVEQKDHVLVVAGCKSCLMYFMVPKQVGVCPKCCGQLLHFHRSKTGSP